MPRAPRYTIRKGHAFYGHLAIPADARHAFGGKEQFMVPLRETDPVRAAAKAMPLVMEWKARIAAVRQGLHDPMRDEIDKLAAKYCNLHGPLNDAGAALIVKAIDFAFREVGGMTALAQHTALTEARGDVLQALQTAPNAQRAVNAMERIAGAGSREAQTPFLTFLEQWQATLRKTKTSAAWINILKEFDQAVGRPCERLSGHHVQTWFDDLLGAGKGTAIVRFKRVALNAYWNWMASHEIVDAERNPFKGRVIKSRQSAVERAVAAKVGFNPPDVPKLWQEAEKYHDFDLSYAIQLAVFMGWRLEELAQLKATDVHRTGGILYISGGMKSEAGLRTLPVPSALDDLVAKLVTRKDAGGYLIRSTAHNKWGLRGSTIGQRFTRRKQRLGYDRRRSFHSLRHSFASMLNAAGVPMAMIRDLMGHAGNGDITLTYIDESELRERLQWLDRAIRFAA